MHIAQWAKTENFSDLDFAPSARGQKVSQIEAAEAVGVSRTTVQSVAKVEREAPDLMSAMERQLATLRQGDVIPDSQKVDEREHRQNDRTFQFSEKSESRSAVDEAARLFNTNRQYVSDAKKLQEEAPDLLEAEARERMLAGIAPDPMEKVPDPSQKVD